MKKLGFIPYTALMLALMPAAMLRADTTPSAPWTMKRLPDTGQTTRMSDSFGEDSFYNINSPSFKANSDGTVTDLVTGLQWQQADNGEMTWDSGVAFLSLIHI